MVLVKSWMMTSLVESASDMKKQQSTKVLRLQGEAGWATEGGVRKFGDSLRKQQAWESSEDVLSSSSTPKKGNTAKSGGGELRLAATGEEFTIARGNSELGGRMLVPVQRQPIPVLEGNPSPSPTSIPLPHM